MRREYWNKLSEKYDDEIFSVLENDSKRAVCGLIKKYGSAAKTANDYGCGIGHFLGALSKNFGKVNAIDISYKFIKKAKEKYKFPANIKYIVEDLAKDGLKIPKSHFAFSVNMLIMPSLAARIKILDCVVKHILKDGHLLLVVPAIESVMLTNFRLTEMNLREGLKPAEAVRTNFSDAKKYNKNLRQGIIPIDGVPTKHYLKEELQAMLARRGMRVLEIRKIEYSWDTEFAEPPRWMREPYPWDWLVVAKKAEI